MKIRARDFFNTSEKAQIRGAVKSAESRTAGEIAVMLVDASDDYREATVAGSLALASLASTVLCVSLHYTAAWSWGLVAEPHYTSMWFWIPVTLILLLPSWYLFRLFPALKLALLSDKRVEAAVRRQAILSFYKKGLHRTRNETGILVFISLLERKVRILGDRGIHARIGQEFWNARAAELVAGIRQKKALEALLDVIRTCGNELERQFPSGSHNPDEVPDDVIC